MKAIDLIHECNARQNDKGGTILTLKRDVDRSDYKTFKEIAEYVGGKYINKNTGHEFGTPPDITLQALEACARRVDAGLKINLDDFFPTPAAVADLMVKNIEHYDSSFAWEGSSPTLDHRPTCVLEPSAGDGALIDAYLRYARAQDGGINPNTKIVMIENDPLRAEILRLKYGEKSDDGVQFTVIEGDFLEQTPETIGQFNTVLMNPPFKDWDQHFAHGRSMLLPDGYFGTILPDLMRIGKKKENALDILAEANANLAFFEELESGRFDNHEKHRGAALRTNTTTSIITTSTMPKTMQEQILHHFSMMMLSCQQMYAEIWKKISHETGATPEVSAGIDEEAIPGLLTSVSEYIKSHREDLIKRESIPIHSSIPLEAYAASSLLYAAEDNMDNKALAKLKDIVEKNMTPRVEPVMAPMAAPMTPEKKPTIAQQPEFPGF